MYIPNWFNGKLRELLPVRIVKNTSMIVGEPHALPLTPLVEAYPWAAYWAWPPWSIQRRDLSRNACFWARNTAFGLLAMTWRLLWIATTSRTPCPEMLSKASEVCSLAGLPSRGKLWRKSFLNSLRRGLGTE